VEDVVDLDNTLWFMVDSKVYSTGDLLDLIQQAPNSSDKENVQWQTS